MSVEVLESLLLDLEAKGCHPVIRRRGPRTWRAYVNAAGDFREDDDAPLSALREAVKLWRKAGKPLDGEAACQRVMP